MTRLAERYRRLVALAEHPRTPEAEAASAASMAKAMRDAYPEIEHDAEFGFVSRLPFPHRGKYELQGLTWLASFLGLECWTHGSRNGTAELRGEIAALEVARSLWPGIRTRLNAAVQASLTGWLLGAMPIDLPERSPDKAKTMSEEETRLAVAAYMAAEKTSRNLLEAGR